MKSTFQFACTIVVCAAAGAGVYFVGEALLDLPWWSYFFGTAGTYGIVVAMVAIILHNAFLSIQNEGWTYRSSDWAVGRKALIDHMANKATDQKSEQLS